MKTILLRSIAIAGGVLLLLALLLVLVYVYLSTRVNGELVSQGEQRHYLLHVPETYDPATPAPLVISLHGAYLYPGFQQRLTQWNELADREGFLVVYPKAVGLPPLWRLTPEEDLAREIGFFEDLIDALTASYTIDPRRIYTSGFSNGAAMSIMLSCRLSQRIAAVGLVATPVVPWEWCRASSPGPVMLIHGAADPFALYEGGENFLTTEPLPSLRDWLAQWAARNGCDPRPAFSEPRPAVERWAFDACREAASVVLYVLQEAGHVWPGGREFPGGFAGPNSRDIDATSALWSFFQQHPLRAPFSSAR